VLPTGTGKTFVGATIAAKQLLNKSIDSVLIVVPTTALIEQ
jgi:superfamily II DNA or RNA helicase